MKQYHSWPQHVPTQQRKLYNRESVERLVTLPFALDWSVEGEAQQPSVDRIVRLVSVAAVGNEVIVVGRYRKVVGRACVIIKKAAKQVSDKQSALLNWEG